MLVSFLNFLDITTYANAAALTAVDTTSLPNGMYAAITDLGVFQLVKQSTSTVDGSTIIAGDHSSTTWNVNYNMHLLCNDVSEIDGSQVGSFSSVSLSNGTAAAPSLTFASDQVTGIYRAAANTIGFAGNGAMTSTLSPTALILNTGVQISAPVGTAAAPTYTFTGDLDTGIYHSAANQVAVAVNGLVVTTTTATALIVAAACQLSVDVATAAAPAYSFTGDLDTGIYHAAANQLGLAAAGLVSLTISATALVVGASIQISADAGGTAAAPAYSFTGDLDVGIYRVGANSLGFSTNGLIAANFTTSALNLASGFALQVATVQVVGARNTGWTTFAGTGTKNQSAINVDTFTATDANIRLLGQGVKGILDALILHGLLGA